MNDNELLALATRAAGEPVGSSPDSPQLAELERAVAALRKATLPADARRVRGIEERIAAPARPAARLLLIAASLLVCLGLVAAFAALNSGVEAPLPSSLAGEKPAPAQQRDWLDDQVAQASKPASRIYEKGELRLPKTGGGGGGNYGEPKVGGGSSGGDGSDTSGGAPRGGTQGAGTGDDLLGPVAAQVDFRALVPTNLPKGFALSSARVFRAADTGLTFDVLRLTYRKGDSTLVIFEAESGFPWRSDFIARAGEHAVSASFGGTAALVVSAAFTRDALEAVARGLAGK